MIGEGEKGLERLKTTKELDIRHLFGEI